MVRLAKYSFCAGFVFLIALVVTSGLIWIVGATVEHFTP